MPSARRLTLVTKRSSPTSWHFVADRVGQCLPAVQIVFGHAVLDRDDRIARDEVGEIFAPARRARAGLALAFVDVFAVLEELGRGAVEREHDVVAGLVAGLLDRFMTKSSAASADGRFGAKPPSSPTLVLWPAFLQFASSACGRFPSRSAAPSAKRRRADRHDHEFLEVDRIVGMHAAIDDVHHRHRQHARRVPPT